MFNPQSLFRAKAFHVVLGTPLGSDDMIHRVVIFFCRLTLYVTIQIDIGLLRITLPHFEHFFIIVESSHICYSNSLTVTRLGRVTLFLA